MDINACSGKRSKNSINLIFLFVLLAFMLPANLFAATAPLNVDWTSKLRTGKIASKKALNFSTPVIMGDRVYVGNLGGYFYCIDLVRGKKIWEIKLKGAVQSKPLIENGAIYVGDGKGYVYSIIAENGDINWQSYIGEDVMTTPASDESSVYIASENNSVFSLDKESGTMKWMNGRRLPFTSMAIKGFSNPVLIDQKLYVGNTDGVVVIYGATDGRKIYTLPVATGRGLFTDIDTSPLKHDNKLVFSSMEGGLYCVDYRTGKEIWSVLIGTPNNIVYRNGMLYVSASSKVYCLRIENGETVWEKDLDAQGLSQPALGENFVAVVSTSDKLYLLDGSTGEVKYERHLGGGTFGAPVISDGRLLVLTNSGRLYAFRINVGE